MAQRGRKLFDSIAGGIGYKPANSTGLGCLMVAVLALGGCIVFGQIVSQLLRSEIPQFLSWAAAAAGVIAFMRFAKRHS